MRIVIGTYEPEQSRLFEETLRPGDTVLDVGAHAGYYTLLAAVLVGEHGRVWAFEPDPHNFSALCRHVRINRQENVTTAQLAVSDTSGAAHFVQGSGSGTGRLCADGAIEVETTTLDEFCASRGIRPAAIKIDVEGAEAGVLQGAERTLATQAPTIFLSTHGAQVRAECVRWLQDRGYSVRPVIGSRIDAADEFLCSPGTA
jgi:FkbM family methyltransferase